MLAVSWLQVRWHCCACVIKSVGRSFLVAGQLVAVSWSAGQCCNQHSNAQCSSCRCKGGAAEGQMRRWRRVLGGLRCARGAPAINTTSHHEGLRHAFGTMLAEQRSVVAAWTDSSLIVCEPLHLTSSSTRNPLVQRIVLGKNKACCGNEWISLKLAMAEDELKKLRSANTYICAAGLPIDL